MSSWDHPSPRSSTIRWIVLEIQLKKRKSYVCAEPSRYNPSPAGETGESFRLAVKWPTSCRFSEKPCLKPKVDSDCRRHLKSTSGLYTHGTSTLILKSHVLNLAFPYLEHQVHYEQNFCILSFSKHHP